MKFLFTSLLALAAPAAAFASITICTSTDFNPQTADGQSLKVTLDSQDGVLLVEKMEGSWYCDHGQSKNPAVVASHASAKVYDVNFGCDESNGRLSVPTDFATSKKMTYSFSDPESGKYSRELHCH